MWNKLHVGQIPAVPTLFDNFRVEHIPVSRNICDAKPSPTWRSLRKLETSDSDDVIRGDYLLKFAFSVQGVPN